MSIALLALAGLLLGGALSLRQQGSKLGFGITLALAVLAAAGGLLWLYGKD
ncbi:hypothetical protein KZZ52_50435 [Dactylosporangium sp. AC04546]|uniref:hypothetical protein n=1 Tax=Dactylosporangium sp. AC04546 TaxID=2862460 RepID=UPI001EDCEE87|nr:hypothetical protein [Dactylosporangium sp. AC04546]WVK82093.1 hypothetical protein KZZ52_50435 [Dactylosporangium sp. AC04546]